MNNASFRVAHVFDDTPHHNVHMITAYHNSFGVDQIFFVRSHPNRNDLSSYSGLPRELQSRMRHYATNVELISGITDLGQGFVVIFHSLWHGSLAKKILFSTFARRAVWVAWGADLYSFVNGSAFRKVLKRLVYIALVRRLAAVVTLNVGDSIHMQKQLFAEAVSVLPYPLLDVDWSRSTPCQPAEKCRILIGNSAAESNNHLAVFDAIRHWRDADFEIICPLGYAGTPAYVDNVMGVGREIFGDKFIGLTGLLDKSEYEELISSCSICILGAKRQQGLYVAYSAFRVGAVLVLDDESTSFDEFVQAGFYVIAIKELHKMTINEVLRVKSMKVNEDNFTMAKERFSESSLMPKWRSFIELTAREAGCGI